LGIPKVHLSFSLDSSGIVALNKAEATVELPPEPEVPEEKEAETDKEAEKEEEKAESEPEKTEEEPVKYDIIEKCMIS